jgi:hypothetical protein
VVRIDPGLEQRWWESEMAAELAECKWALVLVTVSPSDWAMVSLSESPSEWVMESALAMVSPSESTSA